MRKLIDRGIVEVIEHGSQKAARKNAFYLSWDNYKGPPKVVFKSRSSK
jgi:hypothetical protein